MKAYNLNAINELFAPFNPNFLKASRARSTLSIGSLAFRSNYFLLRSVILQFSNMNNLPDETVITDFSEAHQND